MHAFGRGNRQVHFVNVYGHSGARGTAATREDNEVFLLSMFRYADSLGEVSKFVFADFNDEVETSTVLSVATAGGRYVDLVASAASARGDAVPPWTFRQRGLGGRKSRRASTMRLQTPLGRQRW